MEARTETLIGGPVKYKGHVNQLRFNFPLLHCRVGGRYKAMIAFEVTELSKTSATVDILELGEIDNTEKKVAGVIPSPS